MADDTILTKTNKGVQEIRSRASGLPQRARALLILVDGRASVESLRAKLGGYVDFDATLARLVREGFVADVEPAGGVAEADLRAALQELAGFFDQSLGPQAVAMSRVLSSASTRPAFEQAMRRATSLLMGGSGPHAAGLFQARAQAILDMYFNAR